MKQYYTIQGLALIGILAAIVMLWKESKPRQADPKAITVFLKQDAPMFETWLKGESETLVLGAVFGIRATTINIRNK